MMEQENTDMQPAASPQFTVPAPRPKRERFAKRLAERFPDRSFADDDDEWLYDAAYEAYDQDARELDTARKNDKAINEMFDADPRSAQVLMALHDRQPLALALAEIFGPELRDDLDNIDDPETQQKMARKNAEYVERVAQSRQLEEEYNANLPKSLEAMDAVQQQTGATDEQMDKALEFLMKVQTDAMRGIFAPQSLMMALNALRHDDDVAQADAQGEVRGRNAKIDDRRRWQASGDRQPQLAGQNAPADNAGDSQDLFALADRAQL